MIPSTRRDRKTRAIDEVLAMMADVYQQCERQNPPSVRETVKWLEESATEFCTALDVKAAGGGYIADSRTALPCRASAAIAMRVEDVYPQNRRLWMRLHEKGGKQHAMPCHHNLETYLHEYIDGAGLENDPKALLFQTYSRATGQLTGAPLPQANAYAMIQRRAKSAGITTRASNHTFRATGVTAYLKNGGTLERSAQMANHASTRTTQLYDRRTEEVTLDEVERILV
jgi:integrase